MNHEDEKEETTNEENNTEIAPTYNFKWMLILLLVGIIGSFIYASIKQV